MEPVGFADPVDVAGHCQSSVQLRRRTHCRAHPRERGTDGYADNRHFGNERGLGVGSTGE